MPRMRSALTSWPLNSVLWPLPPHRRQRCAGPKTSGVFHVRTRTAFVRDLANVAFVFYGLRGCSMKDFWQHDNGKVYAVRSDSFGRITGAAGPFDPDNLGSLEDFHYGPAIVEWVKNAIAERKLRRIHTTPVKQVLPNR